MQPGTRKLVSLIPLALQGFAVLSANYVVSFVVMTVVVYSRDHGIRFRDPAPTRLLVDHPGAAKLVFLVLYLASLLTLFLTRVRMKDEADRLAVQGAVHSALWLAGIVYLGAVLMAAALPFFLPHSS